MLSPNCRYLLRHKAKKSILFDLKDNQEIKVFEGNPDRHLRNAQFSPDCRYFIFEDAESSQLHKFDILSGKTCHFTNKTLRALSPDSKKCLLSGNLNNLTHTIELVDLETNITIASIDSLSEKNLKFTDDSNCIEINEAFDLQYLDISFCKDHQMQAAIKNQITQTQSIFLMLLDDTKKKNKDKPISLLHDIALKRALPLKELQDTLATFHPLIQKSLVTRYKIIDQTPNKVRAQTVAIDTWGWQNVLKLSLAGAAVGVLGYLWWNNNSQSKSK